MDNKEALGRPHKLDAQPLHAPQFFFYFLYIQSNGGSHSQLCQILKPPDMGDIHEP